MSRRINEGAADTDEDRVAPYEVWRGTEEACPDAYHETTGTGDARPDRYFASSGVKIRSPGAPSAGRECPGVPSRSQEATTGW